MEEQFHKASILPLRLRLYFFFRNILVKLRILKPIYWTYYEMSGIGMGNLQSVQVVGREYTKRKAEHNGPPIKLNLD